MYVYMTWYIYIYNLLYRTCIANSNMVIYHACQCSSSKFLWVAWQASGHLHHDHRRHRGPDRSCQRSFLGADLKPTNGLAQKDLYLKKKRQERYIHIQLWQAVSRQLQLTDSGESRGTSHSLGSLAIKKLSWTSHDLQLQMDCWGPFNRSRIVAESMNMPVFLSIVSKIITKEHGGEFEVSLPLHAAM